MLLYCVYRNCHWTLVAVLVTAEHYIALRVDPLLEEMDESTMNIIQHLHWTMEQSQQGGHRLQRKQQILIDIRVPSSTDKQACGHRVLQYHRILGDLWAHQSAQIGTSPEAIQEFLLREALPKLRAVNASMLHRYYANLRHLMDSHMWDTCPSPHRLWSHGDLLRQGGRMKQERDESGEEENNRSWHSRTGHTKEATRSKRRWTQTTLWVSTAQDSENSPLPTRAAEDDYQATVMEMDRGSMDVAHRPPTETAVDDLSRVLRWLDESTAEDLRELTSRQRQPQLQRTDLGTGAALGMDMVDREKLTQQQHQSDYGTIEALQTWLTQQATDEASRHETTKDSRTMSRWCQQVEWYRHSFLQWLANYSGQTNRLAVALGDLEREGEADIKLDNGHQKVEDVTTGTCNVTVQPGESSTPPLPI